MGDYVSTEGFDELRAMMRRGLARAPQEVLTAAAEVGMKSIRGELSENIFTGQTIDSFEIMQSEDYAEISSPLASAAVLNDGRRPGSRMPPVDALVDWGAAHGFVTKGQLYLLARAIGIHGFVGLHFMEKAVEDIEAAMPRVLAEAGDSVIIKMGGGSGA